MEITGIGLTEKMPKLEDTENLSDKLKPKVFEIVEAVLPHCVIDPHISTNPGSDDELALEDISTTTAFGLLEEIYKFSELTGEAFEKRRKFRTEPSGSASSGPNKAAAKA